MASAWRLRCTVLMNGLQDLYCETGRYTKQPKDCNGTWECMFLIQALVGLGSTQKGASAAFHHHSMGSLAAVTLGVHFAGQTC